MDDELQAQLVLGLALEGHISDSELPVEDLVPGTRRKRYKRSANSASREPGSEPSSQAATQRATRDPLSGQQTSSSLGPVDSNTRNRDAEVEVEVEDEVFIADEGPQWWQEGSEDLAGSLARSGGFSSDSLLPDPTQSLSDWKRRSRVLDSAWKCSRPGLHVLHIQSQAVPEPEPACGNCPEGVAVVKCLESCHGGVLLCEACDAALHPFVHMHRRRAFNKGFWDPIPAQVRITSGGVQVVEGTVFSFAWCYQRAIFCLTVLSRLF